MTSLDTKRLFTRRALVLGSFKGLLTGVLIGRLGYLGLIKASHYRTLANGNRIKLQVLLPQRGGIIDRYGTELASNAMTHYLTLTPDYVKNLEDTLRKIDELLVSPPEQAVENLYSEIKKSPKFKPFLLKSHLSWEEVCKVQLNRPELEGISVEAGFKRFYPASPEFSHILGFVQVPSDKDDVPEELASLPDYRIGRTGLEKQYEETLRGKPGYQEIEVNAHRHIVRYLKREESLAGQTLALSLDAALQKRTFQRLSQEKSGAAVVLDIKTGELLSCVSVPSFDANLFVNGISHTQWEALNTSLYTPLNNKALQGVYPPGSIFKLVVAMAALETGKISSSRTCFCKGFVEVGSHRFHCIKKHGQVNMIQALERSCDAYFYELALLIGSDCIAEMAFKLGLGELTYIEVPSEKKGLVPTRTWKKQTLKHSWTRGDTTNMSIGQGAMLSTPLQMALLIARLVTGTAVRPTLLPLKNLEAAVSFVSLPLKPENLEVIRKGMEGGVNAPEGTAYFSRIEEPLWRMGGKTATSQVRRISKLERVIKNEELEWKQRDHSIFAGYAPLHDPRYAICVLVEHGGGGGRVAAPIARDILREVQKRRLA